MLLSDRSESNITPPLTGVQKRDKISEYIKNVRTRTSNPLKNPSESRWLVRNGGWDGMKITSEQLG